MAHEVILQNGDVISDDRGRLDMAFVHASLANAYWAKGRPPALTERSVAHCLCFGVYAPEGGQIGFARLLTDYTFRAHLGDVFIDPAARGRGLGRALIGTILSHPELTTVVDWTLKTRDAHWLYRPFGFRGVETDPDFMILGRESGGSA
jgi:GNAT superfamily N-acetyltransferase